jgi:hypothetical protein
MPGAWNADLMRRGCPVAFGENKPPPGARCTGFESAVVRLDVPQVLPDTLNDTVLTGDDTALLCYRLREASN